MTKGDVAMRTVVRVTTCDICGGTDGAMRSYEIQGGTSKRKVTVDLCVKDAQPVDAVLASVTGVSKASGTSTTRAPSTAKRSRRAGRPSTVTSLADIEDIKAEEGEARQTAAS